MYREGKLNVTVEELKEVQEVPCPFSEHIAKVIDMQQEPWSGFSEVVAKEVKRRYQNLAEIATSGN